MISSSMPILFYTIQVIPNICIKFQNPRHSSSWEIFDTNFPMYYNEHWSERWKNKKKRSKKIITASWFSFPQYTCPLLRCIQNLMTLALRPRILWQIFLFLLERKKKGQIKGMISRWRLILFCTIQQVIPSICTKFQNPKCSSSWEIFDGKKVYTQTHTHNYEKTKTI